MSKRRLGAGLTLIVLTGGLVACGGSAQTSQGPTSSAGNPATGHGSPANAINIYDIGPNPDAALDPTAGQAGMEAAVQEINSAGGINGRPIHVTFCNAITSSATLEAQCAQSAAADPTVVADIGHVSVYDQGDPIELAAGLTVSGYPISPGDATPANSFPLNAGSYIGDGQAAGAVRLLNAKRLCYAYVDVPGVGTQATLINQWILQPRNLSLYKSIPLPFAASDLSPQAAQASGCDAIEINSPTGQSIQFIKAVRSLGKNVPLILGPASGPSALQQALGSSPTNIYEAGWFYENSPGFTQYEKDMAAVHYANTQYDNECSVMSWAALKEFAVIAKSLPSVTRQAVLAAYKHQSNVTTLGLTPALNLTIQQAGASGKYPVVRNDTTVLYKYESGSLHFMGDPQHPFLQLFPGGNASTAANTAPFASK
jgi:Periplasmic binding protein